MNEYKIYRLNDNISFRKCSLSGSMSRTYGDCTDFSIREKNWERYYECNSYGIHLHCTKDPEIELIYDYRKSCLLCPKCKKEIPIDDRGGIIRECLRLLNSERYKNASIIRLDDWYFPEIKEGAKTESGYWIKVDVKTDKDSDTIIVVYVGHKDYDKKAQFFIKPEKHQLTCDHKDLDPAQIISKIEVILKDRVLTHEYD